MDERDNILDVIDPKNLKTISSEEINEIIARMVEESKENYSEIQGLALECSSALSSGSARSVAMYERGFFKRNWDKLTGKDDKLRTAIAQDQITAQYAMQQTIVCVMDECTRNQKLALVIGEKMEGEILRLENLRVAQNEEISKIRTALVRIYKGYQDTFQKIQSDQRELNDWAGVRCEYCREPMEKEQILCPYCGTVHQLKAREVPMSSQYNLGEIAKLMKASPEDMNLDITWSEIAKKYASAMRKAQRIAQNAGVLGEGDQLNQDITALINKCKSAEFHIAVVGVLKAGKSMLMNALIGVDLAAVGLNSTTAALTKFRSSREGHYIKVKFYSEAEWKNLKESASSVDAQKQSAECEDTSLYHKLNTDSAKTAAEKWIGKPSKKFKYSDLGSLREGVIRWTAADSDDHLFAAEVEVGIDRAYFDMPEEVVFVDTPGLQDPVSYRSEITRKYIRRANAVLLAVRLAAFTKETVDTIAEVMNYTGGNRKKVFIVGTQKDNLNDIREEGTLVSGWISEMVRAGWYKQKKEANTQLYTVSAYLHLCIKKLHRDGVDALSNAEYRKLTCGVEDVLDVKRYNIDDLLCDRNAYEKVTSMIGIDLLNKQIDRKLIQKYRNLKVQDISKDFERCKKRIFQEIKREIGSREKEIRAAKKGADELSDLAVAAQQEKEDLENARAELMKKLESLKEFTHRKIDSLSIYKE